MGVAAAIAVLTIGVAAGLLSGLIGIGGGVLIVPFLYFLYGHPEWFGLAVRPELVAVVAHATSLFVILPTSIRGALAYHTAGLVVWRAALPIGAASVLAAVGGAQLAVVLRPEALKLVFGVLLVASAARLVWRDAPAAAGCAPPAPLRLSLPVTLGTGAAVGLFSGLLGVGGGIIAIPLLLHVVRVELARVAATSLAIIVFTALAGTLSYMVSGAGVPGLPPASLGYVHVAAGAVMAIGAVASVSWGARINRRLPAHALALVFAAAFALLGARLLIENAAVVLGTR